MSFDLLCGCSLKRLSVASHALLAGQRPAEVSSWRDGNRLVGKLSSLSKILAIQMTASCLLMPQLPRLHRRRRHFLSHGCAWQTLRACVLRSAVTAVCTENLIRFDDVVESLKLAERLGCSVSF